MPSDELTKLLDWLAEDYIELEDPEVKAMWELDKAAAIKRIIRWKDAQLLKALPEKKPVPPNEKFHFNEHGYAMGFNACLEAIKSKVTREKK